MKYCKKCMYPETSQPTIYFDDDGVCSGCRYVESRKDEDVDWKEREEHLLQQVFPTISLNEWTYC